MPQFLFASQWFYHLWVQVDSAHLVHIGPIGTLRAPQFRSVLPTYLQAIETATTFEISGTWDFHSDLQHPTARLRLDSNTIYLLQAQYDSIRPQQKIIVFVPPIPTQYIGAKFSLALSQNWDTYYEVGEVQIIAGP